MAPVASFASFVFLLAPFDSTPFLGLGGGFPSAFDASSFFAGGSAAFLGLGGGLPPAYSWRVCTICLSLIDISREVQYIRASVFKSSRGSSLLIGRKTASRASASSLVAGYTRVHRFRINNMFFISM